MWEMARGTVDAFEIPDGFGSGGGLVDVDRKKRGGGAYAEG